MINMQRNAAIVWAGDPDWHPVTVGMTGDLHAWLIREAKRRKISQSEMVRALLIEAYARREPYAKM